MRMLIVDDDIDLCDTLKQKLKNTFVIDTASTGEDGLYLTQLNKYQVVVLDISLPDMDGVEVCRMLRAGGYVAPILMLTGKTDVGYKVRAMEIGADDYLTKPFDSGELVARVNALDRRINGGSPVSILGYKGFAVDTSRREVRLDGVVLPFTRHEYDLFECLFKSRGKIITRDFASQYVWEDNLEKDLKGITVHISSINKKINKLTKNLFIRSVYGIGYIFE